MRTETDGRHAGVGDFAEVEESCCLRREPFEVDGTACTTGSQEEDVEEDLSLVD
jgi:hypothetical protein